MPSHLPNMTPIDQGEGLAQFDHPLYDRSYLTKINKDRVADRNKSFDEENTMSWMSSSIDLSMPETRRWNLTQRDMQSMATPVKETQQDPMYKTEFIPLEQPYQWNVPQNSS